MSALPLVVTPCQRTDNRRAERLFRDRSDMISDIRLSTNVGLLRVRPDPKSKKQKRSKTQPVKKKRKEKGRIVTTYRTGCRVIRRRPWHEPSVSCRFFWRTAAVRDFLYFVRARRRGSRGLRKWNATRNGRHSAVSAWRNTVRNSKLWSSTRLDEAAAAAAAVGLTGAERCNTYGAHSSNATRNGRPTVAGFIYLLFFGEEVLLSHD